MATSITDITTIKPATISPDIQNRKRKLTDTNVENRYSHFSTDPTNKKRNLSQSTQQEPLQKWEDFEKQLAQGKKILLLNQHVSRQAQPLKKQTAQQQAQPSKEQISQQQQQAPLREWRLLQQQVVLLKQEMLQPHLQQWQRAELQQMAYSLERQIWRQEQKLEEWHEKASRQQPSALKKDYNLYSPQLFPLIASTLAIRKMGLTVPFPEIADTTIRHSK